MRLSMLILPIFGLVGMAAAQTCTNGLAGIEKSGMCCVADCGQCGGVGCGAITGFTGDECCTSNIAASGNKCSATNAAPCIVDDGDSTTTATSTTTASGTTCSNGMSGVGTSTICCAAGCGTCGGSGCAKRGSGLTGEDCCTSAIKASGDLCSETGKAPCNMDGSVSAPTPTPPTSGSDDFVCSGIYGVAKSGACCPAACGTCGGSGCGTRGEDCCTGKILDSGEMCSSTKAAPCVIDEGSVSAPTPTPPTSGSEDFVCSGIYGVAQSGACCPADCGTCGGSGCGKRGENCCTGKILDSGLMCSSTKAAPCIIDEDTAASAVTAPSPSTTTTTTTPTSPTPVPSSCSSTATITFKSDNIVLSDGGCATLTDIYNAQSGTGPLYVTNASGSKSSGSPTGYWLLTNNIFVYDDVTLFVEGTGSGGDCDYLRMESTSSKYWEIRGHGGNLYFDDTKVTSWDTGKSEEREYTGNRKDERSFIRCITEYDDNDTCDGASSKTMGTCRMDIIGSTMGNLGYYDAESYGLTWKVRGLCTDKLENVDIFEKRNVYGDIKNSDIYGMYYGMYSYGHQGGVWTNNKMHDNVEYGFDPHDDSDYLTIANNKVYNNGNHGIIASKRCNNVKIYGNEVYGGKEVGIMLHRSSDDAEVYDNYIHDNDDAGIAFFESFNGKIYDNKVENCAFGIRLSLGAGENHIYDNTFSNLDRYGLYLYKGNDDPDVVKDGRPFDNVFEGNVITNVEVGVQAKESDGSEFKNNVFTNVEEFEFPDSEDIVWTGNTIGDACMEDSADFSSGSVPLCD